MVIIDVLYGYPGEDFSVLHHVGLTAASLGAFCYISLFVSLYLYGIGATEEQPFSKWPITEKLFMHLSMFGAVCGSCHILDHLRILAKESQDPRATCNGFGLILHTHVWVELLVMMYAAANACVLYKWQVHIPLGPYDWSLVVMLYIVPAVISLLLLVPGLMGPTGAW